MSKARQFRKTLGDYLRTRQNKPKGSFATLESLKQPSDLPSVEQTLETLEARHNAKEGISSYVTKDPATQEITQRIIAKKRPDFLPVLNPSTHKKGENIVTIRPIEKHTEIQKEYEEYLATRRDKRQKALFAGGPAATDGAFILNEINKKNSEKYITQIEPIDIQYLVDDYYKSNAVWSASQFHIRHGTALNAEDSSTGHHLLPTLLFRRLFPELLEEALKPGYRKIDVKEFREKISLENLMIYFGNEFNWLKQKIISKTGRFNEHDLNRLQSALSLRIGLHLQKVSGIQIFETNPHLAKTNSLSRHIVLTEAEKHELEKEHSNEFFNVGIHAKEMTQEELNEHFPKRNSDVLAGFKYKNDNALDFSFYQRERISLQEQLPESWLEGVVIADIFVENRNGEAHFVGVRDKDGKCYFADNAHLSLGYRTDYKFEESDFIDKNLATKIKQKFGLLEPIPEDTTVAAGASMIIVLRKSESLRNFTDKYGSIGQIANTNGHFTQIAEDDEHIIVRCTGGGNTGSEETLPTHALANIANTRRLFGDDFVGIHSIYGCPRWINAKNSTQFAQLAEGLIISYGKGGTGVTKRFAEAVFALHKMGHHMNGFFLTNEGEMPIEDLKRIVSREGFLKYFNYNPDDNKTLELNPKLYYDDSITTAIFNILTTNQTLIDQTQTTSEALGYKKGLTAKEKLIAAAILATSLYFLNKIKEKVLGGDEKEAEKLCIEATKTQAEMNEALSDFLDSEIAVFEAEFNDEDASSHKKRLAENIEIITKNAAKSGFDEDYCKALKSMLEMPEQIELPSFAKKPSQQEIDEATKEADKMIAQKIAAEKEAFAQERAAAIQEARDLLTKKVDDCNNQIPPRSTRTYKKGRMNHLDHRPPPVRVH